jgi:hypothetical protein
MMLRFYAKILTAISTPALFPSPYIKVQLSISPLASLYLCFLFGATADKKKSLMNEY